MFQIKIVFLHCLKTKLVLEDKKYVLKSMLSLLLGLLDMIRFVKGNLLESSAQALVNIVNAVGVMGKGIASHFKESTISTKRQYFL